MKDFYYGIMGYTSINIGDEIQSIASSRFLPRIDKLVHRETINKYKSDKKTKLITNAWWMWCPENFPPSEDIDPLLIAMHFSPKKRKKILTRKTKEYFMKNGPVGCRDKGTCEWLNKNGIPAYFSGCLTLTLQRNPQIKKRDFILTVDLDEKVLNEIKKRTNRPVYDISRLVLPHNQNTRFEMAKIYLSLYQSAHCVVSSRLHVCMPCLALETPVLMIDSSDKLLYSDERYDGLKDLCNVVTESDFLANQNVYNFERPLENPKDYLEIRESLIKKCSEFTGYNNTESLINIIDTEEIIIKLINYSRYNYFDHLRYLQWWFKSSDLISTYFKKLILRKTRFDLKNKGFETLVTVEKKKCS